MKYIIIILSIMLTGCEKSHQEDLYPQIIYPDYYLSFSGVGIDIDNMKNTDLRTAMFNGSEVGYKASWETYGAKRHVAFIPLKIEKNKSYCVLAHVSRLFIFYFFRWRAVDC